MFPFYSCLKMGKLASNEQMCVVEKFAAIFKEISLPKAYSGPCQKSMIEFSRKIVNNY